MSGQTVRCSRTGGDGWRCPNEAWPPTKLCDHHRERRRVSQAAASRRAKRRGMCVRCTTAKALPGIVRCAGCASATRLRMMPNGMVHDPRAHAAMLALAHRWHSRCAASGLTLKTLRAVGERLTVDRINPRLGYTRANMQLLAGCLNSRKWCVLTTVPPAAIEELKARVTALRNSRRRAA